MVKKLLIQWSAPIIRPINKVVLRKYYQDRKKCTSITPNEKILVLIPHIDDETIGLGGTIRIHADLNCEIHAVVLTDGSSSVSKMDKNELKETRKKEMTHVKDILGITSVEFLDYPDGHLICNEIIVKQLTNKIKQLKPDIIYSTTFIDAHPDHVTAAEILAYSCLELTDNKPVIRLYEINCPFPREHINCVVDISNQFEIKLKAIEVFKSQAIAFDGFIQLTQLKRYLSNQNSEAIEVFIELSKEQFITSYKKVHAIKATFSKKFKQANRTQTLLYALFHNYRFKLNTYKQALHK